MDDPVLLTGARGHVGTALLDWAGDEYDWRLLDRDPPTDPDDYPGEFVVADITDEDAVRDAVAGCGAVVHLAGDPRKTAPWSSVLSNNIDGTHTVLQAAVDEGVEKVAFASSNHAVKHFETERKPDLYREHDDFLLDGSELPRPGNLYGVSKATGELLGRYYHDEHDLSFVSVRIGNLTEEHPPKDYERGQAMWLSYRDCGHLFQRCIEADYDYEIVYGISDNDRKYYSLENAKAVLGYEPMDNSATFPDA
ncbi:NAD-dependent glucose-6-phosphate dehydrogenase Azf [Halorubellus salinus]|uniref:NAD-dependent glucose-6-phosphate dehydrogenase Azf n=1 Tax=Halorubellus salinus TaxID=755309 RepID=UPI001D06E828|nr:NAD-dependent glucose-6-phosphate dehydrogenase Azf [Halorubellus salinus]